MRVIVHNYTEDAPYARRDGAAPRVEITERITAVSWSYSVSAPYETASISTSVRIDELDVLGIGTPRRGERVPALHASGWVEIIAEEERVFYGPIIALNTGLKVESSGRRVSRGVQLSAVSWLSLLSRPFKLSSDERFLVSGGVYDYEQWASIFDRVFSSGAALSVGEGFFGAWRNITSHKTPEGGALSDFGVVFTPEDLDDFGIEGRSLTEVEGTNISQAPVASSGSLWSIFTNTFQPTPQLIDLFPIWNKGRPYLLYRMRPPAPDNRAYFDRVDQVATEGPSAGIDVQVSADPQLIENVVGYTLNYSGDRNNYIEVTSPYLGISQLAGLNSDPVLMRDDVERYGLYPLEIPYPLLRDSAGSLRDQLERLSIYAATLYGEDHAYARASLDGFFDRSLKVGEWARWLGYSDEVEFHGYITRVDHRVTVNEQSGVVDKHSTLQLERVSQGRRSSRKTPESPILIDIPPSGEAE